LYLKTHGSDKPFRFGICFIRGLPKELSKHLHRAFDLRQSSDYQVTQTVSLEEAKDILDKAAMFVKTVEEYISSR